MKRITIADIAQAIKECTCLEWNGNDDCEFATFPLFAVARMGKYIYKINGDSVRHNMDSNTITFTLEVYHVENGFITNFVVYDKGLEWAAGQVDGIITLFH